MLSLDFLDDVRRMNKRQVGAQAHFAAASLCELWANVSRYLTRNNVFTKITFLP